MTLNNMVQDRSMVHETLAYAAFHAVGAPASRTGLAYVRLNGEDFGVYLNLENLDGIALKHLFNSFDDKIQHLYEGEAGDDVFPGGETGFEIDEGPTDLADLEALIDAANGVGSDPWSTRVAPHANLPEMVRMWAVEKYIDHWDGYAGHTDQAQAEAGARPNNYYLFSELSGRFQMLPWGMDQTWIPTIGVGAPGREVTFDGSGGVLFNKCLEDGECFRAYWEALRGVTDTIAVLDPGALAEDTANLLAPWQEEERTNGSRAEYTGGEVDDGVEESLDFIAGRQVEAKAWLDENEPPPRPKLIVDPAGPRPNPPPAPALLFERAARSGRHFTTRVQLSDAGVVRLRATLNTGEGRRKACTASKRSQTASVLTLDCALSQMAMDRLSRRALRLELTFTITLANGRTETVVRKIRLARD